MKTQKKVLAATVLLGLGGITFLSGCKWWPFEESLKSTVKNCSPVKAEGDVLLTIDGKPALTVAEYEEQLDRARQENPQIDDLLNMMPNAEKDFVFKGVATGKLMQAWGKKEGIDQQEEFQKKRKQVHEAVDLQLYMKHFDEAHPVHVSDSDLKKFYEEKKDVIPGLMTAPSGVNIGYVRFDSKDKAEEFLEKVDKAKSLKAFKDEAEKEELTVAEDTVSAKSHLGEPIKNTVLNIKKFPAAQIVKVGDNAYWVLYATGKSEAKYLELKDPRVQQGLKKMLTDERKEKQLEHLIDELKKELNVVENHTYFEKKEGEKRATVEQQRKLMEHASTSDEAEQMVEHAQSGMKHKV